jgi:hypothetical protein
MSDTAIAKKLGCSGATVGKYRRQLGLDTHKPSSRPRPQRVMSHRDQAEEGKARGHVYDSILNNIYESFDPAEKAKTLDWLWPQLDSDVRAQVVESVFGIRKEKRTGKPRQAEEVGA